MRAKTFEEARKIREIHFPTPQGVDAYFRRLRWPSPRPLGRIAHDFPQPVTLRVGFSPAAQSDHCVRIKEIVADRWRLFPGVGG
jgi:hypothetical protein